MTAVMTAAGSSVGLDLHDCHYFRHDPADWAYDRGGQRILLLVVAIQPLLLAQVLLENSCPVVWCEEC